MALGSLYTRWYNARPCPQRVPGARVESARKLAAFLRSPQTQEFIAGFGKGKYDDQPLFFPVSVKK